MADTKVYFVEGYDLKTNFGFRSGPFRDRVEAERFAVELARRPDVRPAIHIVHEEAEESEGD